MPYTIKEIADLAGVSTRTIRYYDEIDLLSPAETRDNGYRYYDQDSLLMLQQIMFLRELDVPLKEIHLILNQPGFNLLSGLEKHRIALQARAARLSRLIETVNQTIAMLQGESIMSDKDYFEGFDETQYEEEAKQRWGHTSQYAESQKKWSSYSNEQKEAIKFEGGEITMRMVGNDPGLSPDDPAVQAAVGDYYAYLNKYFYTCEVEFIRNLADMWVQDPRFAINYERIREGGAEFVRQAVHIFCDRNA
ncbi:MAG TPA: MerR family transcriptional regulator [Chloroflexi bacterium]|nr:MerR family transcriptional regulator [Chloroflexota bacterium]